jgi:hypothetical protein
MSEALGVSRSGFYAWLVRPPSRRRRNNEVLGAQVRQSFIGSDRTYGARRVWHDVLGNPPIFSSRQKWSQLTSISFCMGVMPPSAMFGRS